MNKKSKHCYHVLQHKENVWVRKTKKLITEKTARRSKKEEWLGKNSMQERSIIFKTLGRNGIAFDKKGIVFGGKVIVFCGERIGS